MNFNTKLLPGGVHTSVARKINDFWEREFKKNTLDMVYWSFKIKKNYIFDF